MVEQLTVIDPQTRLSEFAGEHGDARRHRRLQRGAGDDLARVAARGRVRGSGVATDLVIQDRHQHLPDMKRAPQRRCLPIGLSGPGQVPNDPTILATRSESTWVGPIADSNLAASPDPPTSRSCASRLVGLHHRAAGAATWSARGSYPARCAGLVGPGVCRPAGLVGQLGICQGTQDGVRTRPGHSSREAGRGRRDAVDELRRGLRGVRRRAAGAAAHRGRQLQHAAPRAMAARRGRDRAVLAGAWSDLPQLTRAIAARANGQPAVAVYHDVGGRRWEPFAIHVFDTAGGRISAITHFMGPAVFAEFDLPDKVVEQAAPSA
jgi:RNA polymerase sigma-70 factor (ECF subfamily)